MIPDGKLITLAFYGFAGVDAETFVGNLPEETPEDAPEDFRRFLEDTKNDVITVTFLPEVGKVAVSYQRRYMHDNGVGFTAYSCKKSIRLMSPKRK